MIEGHGDDIYRYAGKVKYNFSSNIFPSGHLERVMRHLACNPSLLGAYPEPFPGTLEAAIARKEEVAIENVMVTNGATEAIYLIAHAWKGAVSAIVSPTFSEYEDACRMYGHALIYMDAPEGDAADAGIMWICNPNNPTGRVTPLSVLRRAVDADSSRIVVIDRAYADYTCEPVMSALEAVERGNVILLGSFTKRYSVPGLRVGYAIGDAALLDRVRSCRMPWSVSALAISGAHFLLNDVPSVVDAGALHREALRLGDALRDLGIDVSATGCNFMLCRLPRGSAPQLKEWLMVNHGLLIRDASNFHGLDGRYFRVAAQSPEADDLLINAIKEWISS